MHKILLDDFQPFPLMPAMNNRIGKDRVLKFFGLDESLISGRLKHLFRKRGDMKWEAYSVYPETHLRICLEGSDEESILDELDKLQRDISRLTAPAFFAIDEHGMEDVVGRNLCEKGFTLSVAESCTGGRIGNLLTDVSGSSAYFLGGMIVYSNQSKEKLLNVSPDTLYEFGAVSDRTAREMAENVRALFHSDIGLAVTGIAGPEGGSRLKPVGTVHIGLASENSIFSEKYCFEGTRDQVKQHGSIMALDWVRRYLNGYPFIPGV
ncbi:MAG: nicotinamide-nucleotide amidohydrolase family protein [Deltaproteobacteria bacterium]|nr:nicotinamide-nucleotide amidohydrolase family protein [Deltaproteobacteria bacterium]